MWVGGDGEMQAIVNLYDFDCIHCRDLLKQVCPYGTRYLELEVFPKPGFYSWRLLVDKNYLQQKLLHHQRFGDNELQIFQSASHQL